METIITNSETCPINSRNARSSATAEIVFDVDEMAIQGHSRLSVVVPIDTAYMTSY